ncbi:MAG: TIGR00730 family Rossman fold protein [Micavibrio sp.]|nr:TIGR00730 family Rossman fold protein [Micavibrio sp.]|tara:strand:- start:849 stop:1397 length:549 start_codon:yes stop_codon:yes gene_type:complete
MKKSVCVFCSASDGLDSGYYELAARIGRCIANSGADLVYGGSHSGMMGAVADGALERGAEVTGVIPDFLTGKEKAHENITRLHVTQTMHERQMTMGKLADYFVILPGGLGTMAEFFEVITWRTLGILEKPILLVNVDDFWLSLIDMINKCGDLGFLHKDADTIFDVAQNLEQAELKIQNWLS